MQYIFRKKDTLRVDLENPDRTAYIWVDKERGAKNISCGSTEIPVNSELPYHDHKIEEEMMFVYRGKGVAVIEGGDSLALEPETVVYMPPGVRHLFRNTGSEPLCFVWFYAPPGAEQAIRVMARK